MCLQTDSIQDKKSDDPKQETSQGRGWSRRVSYLTIAVAIVGVVIAQFVPQEPLIDRLDDLLTSLQETDEHLRTHAYLNGNFAPVADEHVSVSTELVEGQIPADLQGLFVRTGPNPLPGWTKRYHWFDGHGMLHNLRFSNGKATYTNQFIQTPRYQVEKQLGKDYFFRFGELNGVVGILKALICHMFKMKHWGMDSLTSGQANTDTVMYNGRFYLLHEASLPFEAKLLPDGSFESLGYSTFGNALDYPVSAHPKVDYQTNSMLFHSYSGDDKLLQRDGPIKYGELLENNTVRHYKGISSDQMNHTCFAHDMMITPNYMVFYDSSTHFDIAQILEGKSIFAWKQEAPLRLALVSRQTGELVRWFTADQAHAMIHPVNAWEEDDGTVVMWSPVGDHLDLGLNADSNFYYMTEIRMNPVTGQMTMERLDTVHNQEFCNVRTDYYGRYSARAVAGILDAKKQDGIFTGFVIWDVARKSIIQTVHYGPSVWGGEPVVIEKPGSDDSKDFYVGTFTFNETTEESFFVLYEQDQLVFKLKMPHRVPYGFHGNWVPENLLQHHFATHADE